MSFPSGCNTNLALMGGTWPAAPPSGINDTVWALYVVGGVGVVSSFPFHEETHFECDRLRPVPPRPEYSETITDPFPRPVGWVTTE
jgi:hypothetical protein